MSMFERGKIEKKKFFWASHLKGIWFAGERFLKRTTKTFVSLIASRLAVVLLVESNWVLRVIDELISGCIESSAH